VISTDGSGERNIHDLAAAPVAGLVARRQAAHDHHAAGWAALPRELLRASAAARGATDITVEQKCEGEKCCELSYNLLARAGHILRSINLETGAVQDQPVSKYSFTPAWDPANAWRVIYRDEQGLAAIDVNRGATWPLTDDSGDYTPAFSPDGKRSRWHRQHDRRPHQRRRRRARLAETPIEVN
jgi:hypothetical protein